MHDNMYSTGVLSVSIAAKCKKNENKVNFSVHNNCVVSISDDSL